MQGAQHPDGNAGLVTRRLFDNVCCLPYIQVVDILWDEAKNKILKETRGLSFEDVAPLILDKKYLAVLEHPGRPEQMIFVVRCKSYTYSVSFVIDADSNINLKTVFPSRKFHKLYGEDKG